MNEIEEILATASEPLPRVEPICTPESHASHELGMIKPEPVKLEPVVSAPAPKRIVYVQSPSHQPSAGDNCMEMVLRVMSFVVLLAGIGYSAYLASELADVNRYFRRDSSAVLMVFLIGTALSVLSWTVLFVLSNISINMRASKHLLARIAQNNTNA